MFVLHMEDSVHIDLPLDVVFAYMDDIEKEHEWQPYLLEWSQKPDPAQNGVGSRRRYVNQFMGRRFINVYEVTEYEPGARVMYRSTPEAAVQAQGGTTWEAVAGGTQVRLYFRPQLGDFWGLVPGPVLRWIYGRTLRNNLARLKACLEQTA